MKIKYTFQASLPISPIGQQGAYIGSIGGGQASSSYSSGGDQGYSQQQQPSGGYSNGGQQETSQPAQAIQPIPFYGQPATPQNVEPQQQQITTEVRPLNYSETVRLSWRIILEKYDKFIN